MNLTRQLKSIQYCQSLIIFIDIYTLYKVGKKYINKYMKSDCTHHNLCFFFHFCFLSFFFKVRALFVGGVMLRDDGGRRRGVTLDNPPRGLKLALDKAGSH